MKKSLCLIICFALIILSLTGCQSQKSTPATGSESSKQLADEQILRLYMDNDPAGLDPQLCVDTNGGEILAYCTDALININKEGKYEPALAQKWEVADDEKEYIFYLRDAKWSDGTPITADDFYYSWMRAIDPKIQSGNAYRFFNIVGAEDYFAGKLTDPAQVGIKVVDQKTFKVTLSRPTPYFMGLAVGNAFRPVKKDFVEKYGSEFASTPDKLMYSGPFKLSKWTRQQQIVLEKNENHWNADNLKLQKITYDIIQDPQVPLQMYQSGDLDVINLDASLLDKFRDSKELETLLGTNIAFTSYNCKNEYFKNINIRKAFSMVLDRDTFTGKVLNNGAKPLRGYVPYGFPGGSNDKDFRSHNGDLIKDISKDNVAKEAQQLLDKGLLELGKTKEDLSKNASILVFDEEGKKQAQVMQQSYSKYFGVNVKIDQITLKVMIDRMFKGDYSMLIIGYSGFYIDPMAYLENFTSDSPMNTSLWGNPKYDQLIKKALEASGDERMDYLYEAEKMLMDEMPISPAYNRAYNFLTKPYVKGFERNPFYGSDINKVYIEKH
ncbi:peptide ABC transporter substrate-binding protein [Lutispora sp.]|uniref:peptide ABC transporter substrate-binding protein n=1 Tax=Lutispora sp. TaxID=2828727 RepID=UPI002B1FB459|nr:peptide ABC transporter substrate-binding protein [Lutispora sp.]MEA4963379.1 peptide ABC transporter substrate-binding protein [Lutispora sp.]